MKKSILSIILLFGTLFTAVAQREEISLNANWLFRFSHQVDKKSGIRVDLPHTWNTQDALTGKIDYKRGIGNYTKKLFVKPEWKGKRLFVRFEGSNSVTDLFVNGKNIGEHRGGYGAFIFEISDQVTFGQENELLVRVNNAEQLDVMPLVGDFNFYGGIYRDLHLIITPAQCISPLDYASPGVYLIQQRVTDQKADLLAKVMLANKDTAECPLQVKVAIKDAHKILYTKEQFIQVSPQSTAQPVEIPFVIEKPHLWNGAADPFMYQVEVTLTKDNQPIDKVTQPLGLRYYSVSPEQGFFLNGKHLPLHGVNRHQERAIIGNALRPEHHQEDALLMKEMGVNAVRLAHYPQATAFYSWMDKLGIVTWAEIPFVGPGGYADKGFVNIPAFKSNGKEQLIELIRQHYNHPSICFWGLYNELKAQGDDPVPYIRELNQLAHEEDPTRPTTAASNDYSGSMNFISDVMAWNRYDGWYGSTPSTLASFLDKAHQKWPDLKIAISEYGAGASIYHQQDSLIQSSPTSRWHPENWQTYYHIENWKIIHQRPYLWGTFVWNMFDFGAAHRTEGDRDGINDKGLVTHDRKIRKDAFYFYKANWNPEPMVYIAQKRTTERFKNPTSIQVFSNCKNVTLYINGVKVAKAEPDKYHIVTFDKITLQEGNNTIKVEAMSSKGKSLTDSCDWTLH